MKAILLFLGLFFSLAAFAQEYSLDWHRISGGGGTSSGGQFTVSGTIGQAEAGGALTGGGYSVTGGFWSFISVVQTPGAPTLRIFMTKTNTAVLAWAAASTGFSLQQNADLSIGSWGAVTNAVSVAGTENQVVVPAQSGRRFFRLVHP